MQIQRKSYLWLSLIVLLALISIWGVLTRHRNVTASVSSRQNKPTNLLLASPGRVEGFTETMNLSASIDGTIQEVPVSEGDRVTAGQVVATIQCDDVIKEVEAAEAERESAVRVLERLKEGSRPEERLAAAHETAAALAVMEESKRKYERYRNLHQQEIVSEDAFREAWEDQEVARARYEAASQREKLVNAGPLHSELQKGEADVSAAEARKDSLRKRLEKCSVRAPVDGTILRRYMEPGESVSALVPRPIVSMADTTNLRVRAEVDEADIAALKQGQTVAVICDAFPGKKFPGKVVTTAVAMGRKDVRTGEAGEKSDRDILEVLVSFDQPPPLPVGLRVTVQFFQD